MSADERPGVHWRRRAHALTAKVPEGVWYCASAVTMAGGAALASPGRAGEGALLAGLLTWAALVDARRFILPDILTGLIAATGILVSLLGDRDDLPGRVLGLLVGYMVFFAINAAYLKARGRDGLGLGDAKLFAGAGAWLGWIGLPWVALLAALTGLAHFGVLAARRPLELSSTPIPFGPHLCVAIWIVWRLFPTYWL